MSNEVSKQPERRGGHPEMRVSVTMERREIVHRQWTRDEWDVVKVMVGSEPADDAYSSTVVHRDETREQVLWTGLRVTLYRDFCEMYWHNLVSGKPRLFVVCHLHEDEDGREQLRPVLITLNQEEANGHLETDNPVFSVPIPQSVLEWLEKFVMDNYVPEARRKRKRTDWSESVLNHEKTPHDPSGGIRH